jgi:hypothetical protein
LNCAAAVLQPPPFLLLHAINKRGEINNSGVAKRAVWPEDLVQMARGAPQKVCLLFA